MEKPAENSFHKDKTSSKSVRNFLSDFPFTEETVSKHQIESKFYSLMEQSQTTQHKDTANREFMLSVWLVTSKISLLGEPIILKMK